MGCVYNRMRLTGTYQSWYYLRNRGRADGWAAGGRLVGSAGNRHLTGSLSTTHGVSSGASVDTCVFECYGSQG